jgi:hypothetical protein
MVGYVADPALCEALNGVREWLVDIEINEEFFSIFLQCLKSPEFHLEGKTRFGELVVERVENEIQYLDEQIQSYNFQDPKKFLEILPPSQQEVIDLPTDIYIDNVQLEVCLAELGQPTESGFRDPIAAYMDMFLSLMDKSGCLFRDQGQHMHEGLPATASVSSWQHAQAASLSGLLEWLIWHFSIT